MCFSMAVALRYIRSDMGASSDADMVPDNAFAADIAGYLEKYVILGNSECLWSFGFNVSNIGTKALTTAEIPTNSCLRC